MPSTMKHDHGRYKRWVRHKSKIFLQRVQYLIDIINLDNHFYFLIVDIGIYPAKSVSFNGYFSSYLNVSVTRD